MMDENSAGCAIEAAVKHLKCWPEPFEEMLAGRKTAEFRLDDRNFACGDRLLIREWLPNEKRYTHREIERIVTHVLRDSYGVPSGYAMLSLATLPVPTISQDVPAPAAVTAEMVREARRAWIEAMKTKHVDLDAIMAAHLTAALSADNARLAYTAGYRDGFHDGNASGEDSWWDQVAAADGWQQYRAALQGADNHE